MNLLELFFLFVYIGLCAVGGGLVAITFMQQELILRGLISPEDFFAMLAVSESTPGPIGVNMATYIGYQLYGVVGGVVLTIGIILPSFVIILFIAKFAHSFQDSQIVKKSFYGLRAGATGMIAIAFWQVLNISVLSIDRFKLSNNILDIVNVKQFAFFVILLGISLFYKKSHPILLVVLATIMGVIFL